MSSRIRLTLLIPTLDRSGAEKQLVQLAIGLSPEEFDVDVLALTRGGPLAEPLQDHGVPIHVLGKRRKVDHGALRRLKRRLRNSVPDILHTWLFAANAYGRLACRVVPDTRVVVSERCVDAWKRPWQLWLDRRLIKRTDQLLTNSQSVAGFYRELGIPSGLIEVIPNGIAVETPTAPGDPRAEVRAELELPENARLVTCIGRLAPQKRVTDLVWAIELLHQLDPRAWLVCVGDGPERNRVEHFARETGCWDRVRFTGHRDDTGRLWAASDVAWLASDFEGQSNSVMEAMAAGLPVVASDIPANAELVLDGQTGHLVPVGDSAAFAKQTAALLADRDRAQQLGTAGRQRMQDSFGLETMIDAHARLYRSLTNDRTDVMPADDDTT